MIVYIVGEAHSGKSEAAKYLCRKYNLIEISLSDPMKRFLMELYGFTEEQLWGESSNRNGPDPRFYRGLPTFQYPAAPVGSVWIPLAEGCGYTLIDATDFDVVSKHSWSLNKKESGKSTDYARTWLGKDRVYLHSLLVGPVEEGYVIDHVNGDGLDNRRANLRVCTHAENRMNQKPCKEAASQFKGVAPAKGEGKWRAAIKVAGKQHALGVFESEVAAAMAYDAAASEHFGDFARLNREMFLSPREALQTLGEAMRECFSDTWVRKLFETMKELERGATGYLPAIGLFGDGHPALGMKPQDRLGPFDRFLVPDVRYKNEHRALREAGAIGIRLTSPTQGKGLQGKLAEHRSEVEQRTIPDSELTAVIQNDSTIEALRERLEKVMLEHTDCS